MTWDELIAYLNDRHFYPAKSIVVKMDKEVCDGLELEANGITAKSRLVRLREVLPKEFRCDLLPNNGLILIKRINA